MVNTTDLRSLSINQMAEMTGIDRRTVKARLAGLDVQRKGLGRAMLYDARAALPMLFKQNSGVTTERELDEATLRTKRAHAEKLELDVQVKRGELVPIDEVCDVVGQEYTRVRKALLAIPMSIAKEITMISDPTEAKNVLDRAISEALEHLTQDTSYANKEVHVEPSEETISDGSEDT